VGCAASALSVPAQFTTGTTDPSWVPTFAVFGDMGLVNELSLNYLVSDARSGAIDVVLHVGDMAYDLDSNGGTTGDAFMNSIQNYSSIIPIQWGPGNHEADFLASFENYRARIGQWEMGGQGTGPNSTSPVNGIFHSFDLGLAHFVMISSEAYFYPSEYGLLMLPAQFAWLEADLAAAAANRAERPWIVLMAHRPFYCPPNDDDDECHYADNPLRAGILGDFAVEPLLQKYGVDVTITAHEHAYLRTYPMYNYTYDVTPDKSHYENPTMPVHFISGAAGCPEYQDAWGAPTVWSAVELNVYGYGRMSFPNASTMIFNFLNVSSGLYVDQFVLTQDNHGPFPPTM
jgi:acid phosphatase type 7